MLTLINPVQRAEPFDHPDWVFEAKFDEFRAAADTVRGRLISRSGRRMQRLLASFYRSLMSYDQNWTQQARSNAAFVWCHLPSHVIFNVTGELSASIEIACNLTQSVTDP